MAVHTNNSNCHFSKLIKIKTINNTELIFGRHSVYTTVVKYFFLFFFSFFSSHTTEVERKYDASEMAFCVICVMEISQKCPNLTFVEITVFHLFCHLLTKCRQNKAHKKVLKLTAVTYPVTLFDLSTKGFLNVQRGLPTSHCQFAMSCS